MEQSTVNLLRRNGRPARVAAQAGLVAGTQSTDTTPPTSTITSPTPGATVQDGSAVTITGTATDAGGGVVAGVEVSTDGGTTWHPATLTHAGRTDRQLDLHLGRPRQPHDHIKSRAVDDSANLETPSAGVTVNVTCPCSIWGTGRDAGDARLR